MSDDDIYENFSLEEIGNTGKEVTDSLQLKEKEVIESSEPSSVQPSTPEDRKWFKEFFCETFGLYTINELTGEKTYSTPEPEVVQNIKIKKFMDINTCETAQSKVVWFKEFLQSKKGRWIKNVTLNVFIQQLPNYIEAKIEEEKVLVEEAEEKKKLEELEQKRQEEAEKKRMAEERYQENLTVWKEKFSSLGLEEKLEFFLKNCEKDNAYFRNDVGYFFDMLPDLAKSVVYRFNCIEDMKIEMERLKIKAEEFVKMDVQSAISEIIIECQYDEPLKKYYASFFPENVAMRIIRN